MEDSAEGDDDQYETESDSSDDGPGEGGPEGGRQSGANNQQSDSDDDEEEQQFDITLPTTHSYMGPDLVAVRGREVVEAGWRGAVAALAHHGAVFPGETVPLLLPHARAAAAAALADAVQNMRMFALLCPDESGTLASGYGVLCEVYEAGPGGAGASSADSLSVKARANHRVKFVDMPRQPLPLHHFTGMREVEVEVLPEVPAAPPLRHARLCSLDQHRRPQLPNGLRRVEAALTPWPAFVYDMFEYRRMRDAVQAYFYTLSLDKVPSDPVALSFWVASNLALAPRDRLALLQADSALQRLHMALRFIHKRCLLCCASCLTEIARREHIFAMSSDGCHSNYTNLGGFMHDVVTVSRADNIVLDGAASAEYSWFPGYTWTIALCRACAQHVGWRFDAMKRKLRPQQFFGLCRNQVQPAGAAADLRSLHL